MHDDEKQKDYELAEKLISEQNFAAAVIAGAIAMLLAAVAYGIVVERWSIIHSLTSFKIVRYQTSQGGQFQV